MSEGDSTVGLAIVMFILSCMAVGFVSSCSYRDGYEEGYIKACGDARQGRLRYALKENPDGTRIWEEKKK